MTPKNPKDKKVSAVGNVDDYLALQTSEAQTLLLQLRKIFHDAVPGFVEGLSYQIPTFRLDGRQIVSMGAAKKHCALYIMNDAILQQHQTELRGYDVGKGVVRFPLDGALPETLITKLVRAAAKSNSSARR